MRRRAGPKGPHRPSPAGDRRSPGSGAATGSTRSTAASAAAAAATAGTLGPMGLETAGPSPAHDDVLRPIDRPDSAAADDDASLFALPDLLLDLRDGFGFNSPWVTAAVALAEDVDIGDCVCGGGGGVEFRIEEPYLWG
ncbi:uncharacterized protein LOC109714667 [Ananas comosus]|uniref:Uncharacterized protein LOC109714667 n=1 Tax=Ananas comosus TaxID=4615 RepID=A0A6P5FF76_ANACO|nr:uncharacterized protein LOC109714667 [Ananas comosus]